jgi:DNA mismatch repair protein MutS2
VSIEHRSLRSLEWDKLTSYLALAAETAEGQKLCADLVPSHDTGLALAEHLLGESEEALALINNRSEFNLTRVGNIRESLGLLKAGAVLSALDIGRVGAMLTVSKQVRASLNLLTAEHFPYLRPFSSRLVAFDKTTAAINQAIEYDTVKDEASSALRSLRREKLKLENSVKDELNRFIQSQAGSKALQEPIYTMRGGRYVLPVMANMRYSLEGIVHDASQSGLTVYLEPMAVVELSNQIRIKEAAIESEISRILKELCDLLSQEIDSIAEAYQALVELDCIMARGRLAAKYNGTKPELTHEPVLFLEGARHPLLVLQNKKDQEVIANDIRLSGKERTLVITGPNTGGKTVLLKLIGLTALMLRAGLLLPVKPGSRASLFPVICADIGDEQSIEQSLSTFSAHMQNVVEIVDRASPGMLVLLDEVGAGTDPKEGAALARAVLEHLLAHDVVTVATTHLGELKTLAFENPGFVNASFEFDEDTLSPTYKLRLGVPGSSKANTIALRLGLAPLVVQRARQLTEVSAQEFDQILQNLNAKIEAISLQEEQLALELAEAARLKAGLEDDRARLKSEREKVRSEVSSELRSELKQAREIVRELTASLQRSPSMKAVQKTASELKALEATVSFLQERQKPAHSGPELAVGMRVKILSLNQIGHINELAAGGSGQIERVLVQVGVMKIKVAPDDLLVLDQVRSAAKTNKDSKAPVGSKKAPQYNDPAVFVRTMSNTLDLRGQRVDAALSQTEAFIDQCSVQRISPLMIIHGHGTGAVKSAVRDFLKSCGYPARFRPGENYEGGDGVTVVELGD